MKTKQEMNESTSTFIFFQILDLRIVHDQQLRLMTSQEQKELRVDEAFNPFMGLNPLQYNPYTQPLWQAAVSQYERVMAPAEQKTVSKLRGQFRQMDGNPHQVCTMNYFRLESN